MKYLLLLLFALTLSRSEAQVIPDFDYRDGQYFSANANDPYSGVIYQYHDNGEKRAEIILLEGKIHGQYKEWYANGKLKSTKDFDRGLRDGLFVNFHKDGKSPKVKGYYVQGIPFGHWHHFSKRGDVIKSEEYNSSGEMIISRLL